MDRAAAKYFQKLMTGLTAEAMQLFAIASELLARSDSPGEFNIPLSHFQHQADVTAALVRSSPAIVGDVHLLLEFGEDEKARKRVKKALETLREVDPAIYMKAPSARLLAILQVGADAPADVWASAVSSADWADSDTRRRNALPARRRLIELGQQVPSEDDVADLLTRDQAVSAMLKRGGGAVSSRRA